MWINLLNRPILLFIDNKTRSSIQSIVLSQGYIHIDCNYDIANSFVAFLDVIQYNLSIMTLKHNLQSTYLLQ